VGEFNLLFLLVIPIALIAQSVITRRYDWRCQKCDHTFSLSPLSAAFLPHGLGGRKYARCPDCGARSWATPVAKE
jgi:DNA-directed RNA polymerase subunit RPC12/RpoP